MKDVGQLMTCNYDADERKGKERIKSEKVEGSDLFYLYILCVVRYVQVTQSLTKSRNKELQGSLSGCRANGLQTFVS